MAIRLRAMALLLRPPNAATATILPPFSIEDLKNWTPTSSRHSEGKGRHDTYLRVLQPQLQSQMEGVTFSPI
uniref:Uncharacterized protein n=1 Tax=Oryza meridionalis TaxID=40149 RepID=A0A0E0DAD6_9ORYZ